ncbi:MAG: prepilin-type N-terminal cleavage/methylation domain-containing protein [Nitrospinae bacterium]|nr:prepilin-type N-terminal cleavage/methylation domain-containing protein [Nitrospinota bacterium]
MKPLFKDNSGFTFVEILVASAILSFGLLGITGMSRTTVSGNLFSKSMTTAIALGQGKMESLKRMALSTTLTSANNAVENNIDENGTAGSGIFTRTSTVTGGANQLTTLNISVSWTDSRLRTVTFQTLLRQ